MKKLLKAGLGLSVALCMTLGTMTMAFAASIDVTKTGDTITVTGSGFTAAQQVGILTLKDGVVDPSAIDPANPIDDIDYIDQVEADATGAFTLNYTTSGVQTDKLQTFQVYATGSLTDTFTIEPYVITGQNISGKVTALNHNEEITIALKDSTGTAVMTTNADTTGAYAFTKVPAGTYSMVFSKPSYLTLTINNVVVVAADLGVADKALLAGDQDGNGAINVIDLGSVLSAWGAIKDGAGFDPTADFNQDNSINIMDLGETLTNWGKVNSSEDYVQQ